MRYELRKERTISVISMRAATAVHRTAAVGTAELRSVMAGAAAVAAGAGADAGADAAAAAAAVGTARKAPAARRPLTAARALRRVSWAVPAELRVAAPALAVRPAAGYAASPDSAAGWWPESEYMRRSDLPRSRCCR
jgi:hypothetical protein